VTPLRRPKLGKGVKMHYDRDGAAMLLIPEGALMLNPSATATLELVDGKRSVNDIVVALVERFDVNESEAREDVGALLDRLAERRLVIEASAQ
jgi:pyrroloquinoline quinone biosynthesis protein D